MSELERRTAGRHEGLRLAFDLDYLIVQGCANGIIGGDFLDRAAGESDCE